MMLRGSTHGAKFILRVQDGFAALETVRLHNGEDLLLAFFVGNVIGIHRKHLVTNWASWWKKKIR